MGSLADWYLIQSNLETMAVMLYVGCEKKIFSVNLMFQLIACNCQHLADSWAPSQVLNLMSPHGEIEFPGLNPCPLACTYLHYTWSDRLWILFNISMFVSQRLQIWDLRNLSDLGWPPELALEMQQFNMHAKLVMQLEVLLVCKYSVEIFRSISIFYIVFNII